MFDLHNISMRDAKITFLASLTGITVSLIAATGYVHTIKSAHVAELTKLETQISRIYDRANRPTAVVVPQRNWAEGKHNDTSDFWSGATSWSGGSGGSSASSSFSSRTISNVEYNSTDYSK